MYSQLKYPTIIEEAIETIAYLMSKDYILSLSSREYEIPRRSVAILILQNDPTFLQKVKEKELRYSEIEQVIQTTQAQFEAPLSYIIAQSRQQVAAEIEKDVVTHTDRTQTNTKDWLHKLTVHPLTGVPILLLVIYFGIYQFVGVFGAGTLVDLIETFFESNINPVVDRVVAQILPWTALQNLFAGEYGIITLGLRYAIAIVFPIVTTFFFMFSLLEDSGYLPRLSLLIDKLFKTIGLSGRAVIPMVLGLGCGTMATLVTRTLETKRERLIATLLLALTIPCSAQLGVILGLLSQSPTALLIWSGIMLLIFLVIGLLTNCIYPGEEPCFYIEIPPLRLPRPTAILAKTYARLKWYFGEILPLFILASVLIWLGKLTGLFDLLINLLTPLVQALGLPAAATPAFLYGFFRRDYGAAGLYDLQQQGILKSQQLVVAAITLTLFIPCLAQLQFMLKERGAKTACAIAVFVFTFAFLIGFVVNQILPLFAGRWLNV
jgi:ferrous iron transport protein B